MTVPAIGEPRTPAHPNRSTTPFQRRTLFPLSRLPSDTSPAVQAMLDERLRRMTPAQRVRRALALGEASDRFALAKLRVDHPTASEPELRLRLALRTLPPHLASILARRKGHPELADELG